MTDSQMLQPAELLVRAVEARQPNEFSEYRKARDALLIEEFESRRHIAGVATLGRDLPSGGKG
jgi:predicted dithiol-disulfide oxidoreductase (DUF899 family)